MKKVISIIAVCLATMAANAQEQLVNSDFEQWESISYTYKPLIGKEKTVTCDEPVKWSSFQDGTGGLKSSAATSIQIYKDADVRKGSEGQYCVRIKANSILGVIAQGNLTNGCVNMGSMTATDASGNYNYINLEREDQAMKFTGRPDSLRVWLKGSCNNKANVAVHLVTKGYYQDPASSKNPNVATKVASAVQAIEVTDTWTEYSIPFVYEEGVEVDPEYVLVTFATSATPGAGKATDVLYIDDIVMVYNPKVVKGDADNNGTVDINDANVAVDKFLGRDVEINEEAADMNEDGAITVSDANAIVNTITK